MLQHQIFFTQWKKKLDLKWDIKCDDKTNSSWETTKKERKERNKKIEERSNSFERRKSSVGYDFIDSMNIIRQTVLRDSFLAYINHFWVHRFFDLLSKKSTESDLSQHLRKKILYAKILLQLSTDSLLVWSFI